MTTRKGGPAWKHDKGRVTVDLGTNQVIEDIDKNASVEDDYDSSVAGGESSVSASHAGKLKGVSVLLEKIWRIDSKTTKRTIKTTTQLCRQDMDSKLSRNFSKYQR